MSANHSIYDSVLSALLVMHEKGEAPDKPFIEAHVEVFESLWTRGLGCYRITRMEAGNIRARKEYSGVLTPRGVETAKALKR